MTKFQDVAVTGVQNLSPYIPGKPIAELEREYHISHVVKLASNENPYGPSPKVIQKLQDLISNPIELSLYPDGSGYRLKEKISGFLAVNPNQITLGNGSNDVLDIITRCFAGVGDEVIFSEYAFAVYAICTQAVGAGAVMSKAKHWGHDLNAMLDAINKKTKLIFIANPNNPTGTCLSLLEIEHFLKQVPENIIVVIDEAYMEYASSKSSPWKNSYQPAHQLLHQFENLLISRTFSKAYGLAGLRIGYCLSCTEIADLLNRVRQPFNNNALALEAACIALEDQAYINGVAEKNWIEMKYVEKQLKLLNIDYIPSAGNFICINVSKLLNKLLKNTTNKASIVMQVYDKLLRQGVITRPVINYNMQDHLRITIGKNSENQKLITAIKSIVS